MRRWASSPYGASALALASSLALHPFTPLTPHPSHHSPFIAPIPHPSYPSPFTPHPSSFTPSQVGLLTSLPRHEWAEARAQLGAASYP